MEWRQILSSRFVPTWYYGPILSFVKYSRMHFRWWEVHKIREENSSQEMAFVLLSCPLDCLYGVPNDLNHYVLMTIDDSDNISVGMPFIWARKMVFLTLLWQITFYWVSLTTAVSSFEDHVKYLNSPLELELIKYLLPSDPQQNNSVVFAVLHSIFFLHSCWKIDLYWFCGFCVSLKLWHPVICLCWLKKQITIPRLVITPSSA